jgi:hypothetical protein
MSKPNTLSLPTEYKIHSLVKTLVLHQNVGILVRLLKLKPRLVVYGLLQTGLFRHKLAGRAMMVLQESCLAWLLHKHANI